MVADTGTRQHVQSLRWHSGMDLDVGGHDIPMTVKRVVVLIHFDLASARRSFRTSQGTEGLFTYRTPLVFLLSRSSLLSFL